MKRIVVIFTFICLVAGLGFSQVRTGNIYGKVVDESDTPLPGIMVIASGDFGTLTTITNSNGNFRFISISPGIYQVKAELEGFATVIRKNIRVALGSNVTLTMTMVPKRLEEQIVVEATPLAIDSKKTTHATNLTKEELQILPSARDPFVILELTPGLTMDRVNVGGSESGQQSNYVSRGSGRSKSSWNTDGINVTDQIATGAAAQYYDFDAFEEIQIQTAANDITSMTAGAQINMITKRGGNKFSGGGRFYLTSDGLQSENTPSDWNEDYTPAQIDRITDMGLNIGGPIIKDKLWFWMGGAIQDIQKLAVTGDLQKQKLKNIEFKLNTILGKHRIEGFFNWSDKVVSGRVSNSHLDAWESHYNQSAPHPFFKLQDEFTVSDNLFLSAKAGYFEGGFLLTPIGEVGGIAYQDNALGRYLGTYQESDYIRHQHFYQLMGIGFIENLFGANHEVRFGVEYKLFPGKRDRTYYSEKLRYRDYEDPTTAYRAYIYRPNSNYSYNLDRLTGFFQDSMNFKRVTILLGLRYDIQGGKVNELAVPGSSVAWAGDSNLPAVQVEAQKLNFKWKTFSPRIGIIYDITGKGKTLAKANFGIYGEHIDPSFGSSLASTYGYAYFNWTDANLNRLVDPGEASRPRIRDSFNQLDPSEIYDENLKSPLTLEVTAGVEHELVSDFAVGANIIYRKAYRDFFDNFWWVDDNGTRRLPTPDDWEIGGNMPDEFGGTAWWQYKEGIEETTDDWYMQQPGYHTKYLGLELTFRKRLSAGSKWMVNGSFTWQSWKRYYPTPESWEYNYRPTNHLPVEMLDGYYAGYVSSSSGSYGASMNPRWMAKLGFAIQLPYKINFAGTFTARDGLIAPKQYQDDDVDVRGDSNGTLSPYAYIAPYGTFRLPKHYMLNLRLEKVVKIGPASVVLSLDAFNIFNTNTVLDEEFRGDRSNYGDAIMITSPRIFRFGVRLNF